MYCFVLTIMGASVTFTRSETPGLVLPFDKVQEILIVLDLMYLGDDQLAK